MANIRDRMDQEGLHLGGKPAGIKKRQPRSELAFLEDGRGGWIRTNAWQDQNLLPYRLATPLQMLRRMPGIRFLINSLFNGLCWNARKFINICFVWEAPQP